MQGADGERTEAPAAAAPAAAIQWRSAWCRRRRLGPQRGGQRSDDAGWLDSAAPFGATASTWRLDPAASFGSAASAWRLDAVATAGWRSSAPPTERLGTAAASSWRHPGERERGAPIGAAAAATTRRGLVAAAAIGTVAAAAIGAAAAAAVETATPSGAAPRESAGSATDLVATEGNEAHTPAPLGLGLDYRAVAAAPAAVTSGATAGG